VKKIAHIRQAFNLKCRYSRLRAKGLLTTKEMSVQHGVTTTTINLWAREGRLQKHRYDNFRRCLYEPLEKRHEIEILLKAGHSQPEVARL
jgi:DNA-binding transcriptional MerR regulator